ncbi:MAG: hypothetical protein OEV31_04650, partial [Gammaproteobacteria bacterium]|nr:hypothetical protein [Gammaproteobacteria bacterium]
RHCLAELSPETQTQQTKSGRKTRTCSEPADSGDKTAILKPSASSTLATRRMPADVDTESQLSVSTRFVSTPALNRLTAPSAHDQHHLAHAPHDPGLLRRLLHDRDIAWFAVALLVATVIAGLLALS